MQNEKHKEFQFLDFQLSTARQALYHKQQKQSINTKAYYLLLALVEEQGQILSKETLIKKVWPGQVVTDAALSKQILRLRKCIGDDDAANPIIETHRGVGYRLTPIVTEKTISDHATADKKNVRGPIMAVTLAIALLVYLVWPQVGTKHSPGTAAAAQTSLVILPLSTDYKAADLGFLNYLVSAFENDTHINALFPKEAISTSEDPQALAIDLISRGKLEYASLIQVSHGGGAHQAEVILRTQNQVISQNHFETEKLTDLTAEIMAWIKRKLPSTSMVDDSTQLATLTDDDYALQSYVQGITEHQINQSFSKAKEFLEAAVEKDPDFVEAWVELAFVLLRLDQFSEAISIADTYLPEAISNDNKGLQFDLYYIKAFSNYRLRHNEKATEYIEQSIASIEENPNPIQQIKNYRSLVLLAYLTQNWNDALRHVDQQLQLSRDYYPLDHQLGFLHFTKAEIYAFQFQYEKAQQELDQAIRFYTKTSNPNNLIISYYMLNMINYSVSEYDYGVQVANQAEQFLDAADVPRQKMMYLVTTGLIFNLRGLFDRADEYIERMTVLAKKLDNTFYYILIESVKMHGLYVQNKFKEAQIHANTLKATLENAAQPLELNMLYNWILLINSRVDPPESALAYFNEITEKLPSLTENNNLDMRRAKGHIITRLGETEQGLAMLKAVESDYRLSHQKSVANYVGFEILEILLKHPQLEYQTVIDRLASHTDYDYLFFKLKAQFKARESDYAAAVRLMQENKLRANQLWTAQDQQLLEHYEDRLGKQPTKVASSTQ